MKLILNNLTEIEIISYTIPISVSALYETKNDLLTAWNSMTDENLSDVRIVDGAHTYAHLVNAKMTGVQSVINPDGTITAHFYLKSEPAESETVIDPETADYAEAGRILLGEEV